MTPSACSLGVRWLKFNVVGAIGIGVQVTALAFLVGVLGLNYLAATALAVETAVLHNFVWHERFTWPGPARGRLRRLLKFHLTNGILSLLGNVLLMRLFTGALGVPYLPANMLAIASCSLANFAASHCFVFRRAS